MGLDDPEDLIPAIIIIIAILGFLGGLMVYVPSLEDITIFSDLIGIVHSGFTFLGELLTPYINLEATIMAMIIEVLIVILSIVFIIKVGY